MICTIYASKIAVPCPSSCILHLRVPVRRITDKLQLYYVPYFPSNRTLQAVGCTPFFGKEDFRKNYFEFFPAKTEMCGFHNFFSFFFYTPLGSRKYFHA